MASRYKLAGYASLLLIALLVGAWTLHRALTPPDSGPEGPSSGEREVSGGGEVGRVMGRVTGSEFRGGGGSRPERVRSDDEATEEGSGAAQTIPIGERPEAADARPRELREGAHGAESARGAAGLGRRFQGAGGPVSGAPAPVDPFPEIPYERVPENTGDRVFLPAEPPRR